MAVEKLVKMYVTGKMTELDGFIQNVLIHQEHQLIDAMDEINTGRFTLPISSANMEKLRGLNISKSGDHKEEEEELLRDLTRLNDMYRGDLSFSVSRFKTIEGQRDQIEKKRVEFKQSVEGDAHAIKLAQEELEQVEQSLIAYSYLKDIKVSMGALDEMEHFSYLVGTCTKNNASRLKQIYETVTSMVFHIANSVDGKEEVFLIVTPKDLQVESERILQSLNFKATVGFNKDYSKKPNEILEELQATKEKLEAEINYHKNKIDDFCQKNKEEAIDLYQYMYFEYKACSVKNKMSFSKRNFYFSAWIPKKDRKQMEGICAQYPECIVLFQEPEESALAPTKMKNQWFVRPFENLVKMYGIPAYDELDPTPFLAFTYLFCFGFMFGDVGQGLVIVIAGIIAAKMGIELGGVLSRVGLSSVFFGFMYGSVFGNETWINAIWVRPFHEINTMLITAVICGVVMLLAAYAYSIINKLRKGDLEEGVFGKNGVAGLVLYLSILVAGLSSFGYIPGGAVLTTPFTIIAIVLAIVVLVREPLAHALQKKALYNTSAGDYYVESGFEIFEMLLGMLSNTLSFIRVGAFALTHVGLFLAFETLSEMVGGGIAGVIVLIFGNIMVIGLEGLIVFIQCLRLQFYELFSKYYTGDGREFVAMNMVND